MKVFVLLSRVPYPLEKGDKLRAYHHIRELSKKHEVILCALNDIKLHPDAQKELSKFCSTIYFIQLSKIRLLWNLFKALFSGIPFQVAYFYQCNTKQKIKQLIATHNPDHIFCQLVRVAEYVKDTDIPKTLDYQDVFSKGLERRIPKASFFLKFILKAEYKRMLKYENKVFSWFESKIIISKSDRDYIPHSENNKIVIIPNGVDTEYYKPITKEKEYDLIFSGNMGYPPNVNGVEFLVTKILPEVWKTYPSANLLIAGANPAPSVKILQTDKVEVSGWVKDMRDCYAKSKIFIAPMQIGTGMQNKLLEAMSMQLPCITTSLANNAINAEPDKEILIGNSAEELAKAIILMLANEIKANEIAMNGFALVKNNFSWTTQTSGLLELIENKK